jgi:hypothetical protein
VHGRGLLDIGYVAWKLAVKAFRRTLGSIEARACVNNRNLGRWRHHLPGQAGKDAAAATAAEEAVATALILRKRAMRAANRDGAVMDAAAHASPAVPHIDPHVQKVARRDRVFTLRSFIAATYGDLRGKIVLDVAGGKGDLSWLLCNVDGADAVIFDPRTADHTKLLTTAEYFEEDPAEAGSRAVVGTPTYQPLAALVHNRHIRRPFTVPRHIRAYCDDAFVSAVLAEKEATRGSARTPLLPDGDGDGGARAVADREGDVDAPQAGWAAFWRRASAQAEEAATPGHHQPPRTDIDRAEGADCKRATTAVRIIKGADVLEAVQSAALIVGFHPDEVRRIPCRVPSRRIRPSLHTLVYQKTTRVLP